MTNSRHTPGPWKIEKLTVGTLGNKPTFNFGIFTGNSERVALMGKNQEANAKFIVQACNAHYDLVGACKEVIEDLEHYVFIYEPGPDNRLQKIKDAIAKAEGGGGNK